MSTRVNDSMKRTYLFKILNRIIVRVGVRIIVMLATVDVRG